MAQKQSLSYYELLLSNYELRTAGEMNQEPSGSRMSASRETGSRTGQLVQTQQVRTTATNSLEQLRIVADQLSHSDLGRHREPPIKQAIDNLMKALKSPNSEEQRKTVINILKSNPPIMKSFLMYREAQRSFQRDSLARNDTRNSASNQQSASSEMRATPTSLTEQPVAGPPSIVHKTTSSGTHENPQVKVTSNIM